MRHLSMISAVLTNLLLASVSSAQQAPNPPGQPCANGLCFIQNTHGRGDYRQPSADFDIDGSGSVGGTYQLNGNTVLAADGKNGNLLVGLGAGNSKPVGFGNTFSGYQAGFSITQEAAGNSFYGFQAGYNNIGQGIFGSNNTFVGNQAGYSNIMGAANTFCGAKAGFRNTSGDGNTFSGGSAGINTTTGGLNTFYGFAAGFFNTTGSHNLYIDNQGPFTGDESFTIRIGSLFHSATYIAGIYGSTSSSGIPVYVDAGGLLGTQPSSLRFKEQVRDMGDGTSALMKLRPVTFLYKPEYDKGSRTLQYGLIAEEVAAVYPELVANDKDGQPYTVRYQYLTTMLLNEAQKQYHRAETQAEVIRRQEQKIDELEQRLLRLEALAATQ